MSAWVDIGEKGYPKYIDDENDPNFYFLICYERDDKKIIEIGYMCGVDLIKGSSERYPYPRFYMPLPKAPEAESYSFYGGTDDY